MTNFDLQPFAAAAFFVIASAFFGDDAFQSLFVSHVEQGLAVFWVVVGVAERVAGQDQRFQFLLALLKRDAAPIVAIEIEQIERIVENGDVGILGVAMSAGAKSGALLHQAEGGATFAVERDCFAI